MDLMASTEDPRPETLPLASSSSSSTKSYTFYFGGELFSSKHLLGNAILAETIFSRSAGKYTAVLPQNLEAQRETSAHGIRDTDILALLACDLGLFHYDGPELDSGTVVEFMVSKFADMPAVLVRSDFRGAGDQQKGAGVGAGDPWNLMTSFFPRTANVVVDAMALYKQGLASLLPTDTTATTTTAATTTVKDTLEDNRSGRAGQAMVDVTADAIIAAFDKIVQVPKTMPTAMQDTVYQWLALMPGFRDGGQHQVERLRELCEKKRVKGLL